MFIFLQGIIMIHVNLFMSVMFLIYFLYFATSLFREIRHLGLPSKHFEVVSVDGAKS